MFPNELKEFKPLADAAFAVWSPGATVVYRLLGEGLSGAAVLKVDVRRVQAGKIESGQYVLKLTKASKWFNEADERLSYERAVKWNEDFSRNHVTRLVESIDLPEQHGYAMLFEIAGASTDAYVTTSIRESSEFMDSCSQIVHDTLYAWADLEPKRDNYPHELLELWLGYRLDPTQANDFHSFVESVIGKDTKFTEGGEVLLNPLKFYTVAKTSSWLQFGCISSLLHGDFHGGNILVHRQEPASKPYWLIDFALSKEGPFGYDQAYLEVAQIMYCLSNSEPTLLINVLKHLDTLSSRPILPPGTYWLFECLKKMRLAISEWRDTQHRRRVDDINRQLVLARIAAGINWANKPLSTKEKKYLALCYAGWAAREYIEKFEKSTWSRLWAHEQSASYTSDFQEMTPSDEALWRELWETVGGFSPRSGKFILVAEAQHFPDDPKRLSSVGQLPWAAVIDIDPYSDNSNLQHHAAPILQSHRGLHIFSNKIPIVDFNRGTAWMMAAGWAAKNEATQDYNAWIYSKLQLIRDFARNIEYQINPDPVFVIVLPGGSLDKGMPHARTGKIVEAIDEMMRGRATIITMGSQPMPIPVKHLHVPMEVSMLFHFLEKTFGYRAWKGGAQIPGQAGEWRTIPIDILRNLQESLVLLHSNILDESNDNNKDNQSSFWSGNPPTWGDLHAGIDVPRTIYDDLRSSIKEKLENGRNLTVVIYHHPGAGGTTLAHRIAWDFHLEYPTAVLAKWSLALSSRLQRLYRIAQKAVLFVAEASELSESHREDLFRELSQANTPVILLYIRRAFKRKDHEPIGLYDPMDRKEADMFYKAYLSLTDEKIRQRELYRITKDDTLARYRTPFFYGLITYGRDFNGVDRYVASHLMGIRGKPRDIFEYLALATIYSNAGLQENLIRQMMGVSEHSRISMTDMIGDGPSRLASERKGYIRLLHQVIAEEVMCDLLGGGNKTWQFELHHLSIDFIRDVATNADPNSQMVVDLFRQLFIDRYESIAEELGERQRFSPLIEDIDSIDKSLGHRVLVTLTEYCPNVAHFWNHLGRHQVYRMGHDFQKAEEYLDTAIKLSPDDYVHYHTLGVVLRYRIRQILRSKSNRDKTAGELLAAIHDYYSRAQEAFEQTRTINPENIYGFITHIQMILEVAESLRSQTGAKNVGQIGLKDKTISEWFDEHIPLAQKLLDEAQQLYGMLDQQQDSYLTACYADLRTLYGDIDQVIRIWELANAKGLNTSATRRALANAYLVRNDWRWSMMQLGELRRIVTLMEQNLRSSGRRDEDYRFWFEAYKFLPEFTFEEALSNLTLWSAHFPSWRVYYYIYVLYFHLWFSGRSDSLAEMEEALEQCQQLVVGRKSISGQWLGFVPEPCPLVSASDMAWNRSEGFWTETRFLRRINGVIEETIPGPQAGWIRIDGRVRAFFVPGADGFSPNADENIKVNFYVGFSPVGLRAWRVQRGHIPDANRTQQVKSQQMLFQNAADEETVSDEVKFKRAKALQLKNVKQFIKDFVKAKSALGADLSLTELEEHLDSTFGIDDMMEHLGIHNITELTKNISDLRLISGGENTFIVDAEVAKPAETDGDKSHPRMNIKTGHIKFFNESRGFGFIQDDSPDNLYFARHHILSEFRDHHFFEGQLVEFRPDTNEQGRVAIGVKPLQELSEFLEKNVTQSEDLRKAVEISILRILNDALACDKTVTLKDLNSQLRAEFSACHPLLQRLGVRNLSEFLNLIDGIYIHGDFPDLVVKLRDERVFGRLRPGEIRASDDKEVSSELSRNTASKYAVQFVKESEKRGTRLKMVILSHALDRQFPGEGTVANRLGFKKLSMFIRQIPDLEIYGDDPLDKYVRTRSSL